MLHVQMLGGLLISVGQHRIMSDLGPAGRLLLGYLLEFPTRVHRRERLADQFWSHLEPERARAALNTALWRVRRLLALEPSSDGAKNFNACGGEVTLELAPWLDVDTHRFSGYVKKLLPHQRGERSAERLRTLEAAVDSYLGPFLEGEDADWVLEERERLHSLYVRAASELVKAYGACGRYEDAIATARKILVADPFREAIHRDLSILLVLNGQRADAVRHNESLRSSFKRELGISPMPETIRLADQIRSGEIFERLDDLNARLFQAVSE